MGWRAKCDPKICTYEGKLRSDKAKAQKDADDHNEENSTEAEPHNAEPKYETVA